MTKPVAASLSGRRVLVTGGTTGIGRATVARLVGEGAKVLTFGRHQAQLDETLKNADSGPGAVAGIVADIATPEGVAQVFESVDTHLGGIDVLINNAGLSASTPHDMPDEEWRYVVETNFVAYLACAREAVLRMQASGGGQIVFIGSISAIHRSADSSVYTATKAGIEAFAETLRKEVAEMNIRVSIILPGTVGADMQEMSPEAQREKIANHQMLFAEDIADAIAFVLTRPERTDIVRLQVEPRLEKSR